MTEIVRAVILAALCVAAASAPAWAEGEVIYVSSEADGIFLSLPPSHGLAPGAQLAVLRGGEEIARVELVGVRETGARARKVEGRSPRSGDRLAVDAPAVPTAVVDALRAANDSDGSLWREQPVRDPWIVDVATQRRVAALPRWLIRASTRLTYAAAGLGRSGPDHRLAASSTLRVSHAESQLSWRHRIRLRGQIEPAIHIYEAELGYGGFQGFDLRGGRTIPRGAARAGSVDGVQISRAISPWLSAGAFGGLRPRPDTLGPRGRASTLGAWFQLATPRDLDSPHRYSLGLSAFGGLQGGARERSAVALEGRWRMDHALRPSVRGSAVLDIDPVDARSRSAELSQAWLAASIEPLDFLRLTARADTFRPAPFSGRPDSLDSAFAAGEADPVPRYWRGELHSRLRLGPRGQAPWVLGVGVRADRDSRDGVLLGTSLDVQAPALLTGLGLRPAARFDFADGPYYQRSYGRVSLAADPLPSTGFELWYGAAFWRYRDADDALGHRAGVSADWRGPYGLWVLSSAELWRARGALGTALLLTLGHNF